MDSMENTQKTNAHLSSGNPNNSDMENLTLRTLVGMKEAGIVIGKQGSNIRAIREASGARVSVSPHYPGIPERILTILGTEEAIAKAYANVARNLNQGDLRGTSHEAVESTPLTLRFLIPNSRMGGLIGKGGTRIKDLQEESNARLVATPTPLPNSGDRILEMIGVPDAIHIATYHMLVTLKHLSDRPCHDRAYRPEHGIYPMQQPHMQMQQGVSAAGMVSPHGGMHQHGGPHNPSHPHSAHLHGLGGIGMHHSQHGSGAGGAFRYQGHAHHNGPVDTRKFVCPAHKVGPLIGKGGLRINRIRTETNCKINIEEAVENNNSERIFSITGFTRDVDNAVRMLENQLRRELSRDADAAANASAGASNVVAANNSVMSSDVTGNSI